jgi:hypothetical protein
MVVGIDNFNYGKSYNLEAEVKIADLDSFYYCIEGKRPNKVVWINGDNDPYTMQDGKEIRYSHYANMALIPMGMDWEAIIIKMFNNSGGINDCVKAKQQPNGNGGSDNGGSDNGGSDNGGSDNGGSDDDEMDAQTKLLIGAGVLGLVIILIS